MLCLVNLPNGTIFAIQCDPKAIGQKCLEQVSKLSFTRFLWFFFVLFFALKTFLFIFIGVVDSFFFLSVSQNQNKSKNIPDEFIMLWIDLICYDTKNNIKKRFFVLQLEIQIEMSKFVCLELTFLEMVLAKVLYNIKSVRAKYAHKRLSWKSKYCFHC